MRPVLMMTVLTLPAVASAWGFHDSMGDGSPVLCVTPRQSAMGGVWALPSSGPASVFLNPAELSMMEGATLTGSAAIIEWRSSVEGENYNNILDTGTGGAGTLAFGAPFSGGVAIGAGISRVSDFGFNGVSMVMEEVNPGIYDVYSIQFLDAQGSLWEANAGISLELADWVTAGLSGGLRFGNGSYLYRNTYSDPQVPGDTVEVDWEASDLAIHGGLLMPFEFGTFAFSGTNGSDRYLSRVAMGFQKDFDVLSGSTLGLELDLQGVEDRPSWAGRAFAYFTEMIPGVRSTYSIGFNRAADHHRTSLCMGTGARVRLGDVDLDLGISWMSRSRAGFQFPEPYVDNIDDAGTYYSAGMTWRI
ncbi:MAG: hypothetical protein JXA64_02465 [Candidatus Fermentibacteraceae bacterium]|nr:hypothetical protein [Candidatus Fermentibacteraceae bacterium]